MKHFIFLLLMSLSITFTVQAHFYAYQEWYHPETGRVLEEFYDNHTTKNPVIDCAAQQQALIDRAKKSGNVKIIVEDKASYWAAENQLLSFENDFYEGKELIRHKLSDLYVHWRRGVRTTLAWSYTHCFINNIVAFNMECRDWLGCFEPTIQEKYMREIALYNDGPILNNFYKNIVAYANASIFSSKQVKVNCRWLVVDARALHAIANCTDKHIMLVAGADHIVNINNILLQLGWQPRRFVVPETINIAENALLVASFLQTKHQDVVACMDRLWKEQFNPAYRFVASHAIAMATIPMNPKLLSAPVQYPSRMQRILASINKNPMRAVAGIVTCIGAVWWLRNHLKNGRVLAMAVRS